MFIENITTKAVRSHAQQQRHQEGFKGFKMQEKQKVHQIQSNFVIVRRRNISLPFVGVDSCPPLQCNVQSTGFQIISTICKIKHKLMSFFSKNIFTYKSLRLGSFASFHSVFVVKKFKVNYG
jgi:hypothetical protein